MAARKILAFDTETTGLDPTLHSIIQLSAVFLVDEEPVDFINLYMQPSNYLHIDRAALDVHGVTVERLRTFPDHREQFQAWEAWLSKRIDKYDKGDKAYCLAYCGRFDMSFLDAWYKRYDNPYLGSWINRKLLDPKALLDLLHYMGLLRDLPNLKLSTVCEYLDIPLVAHDALSDVRGAIEVWKWAQETLKAQLYPSLREESLREES